ncbi:maltodextrin glycosyltransferase [Coprothermobacteraceae bacterium]|nr:maltodextrin glycosyltransferase [Coprothermobacteraceae bacterium]
MYIEKLKQQLQQRGDTDYYVPSAWIPDGYKGRISYDGKHYKVDPYEFFGYIVEGEYTFPQSVEPGSYYIAFPRSTAAYNHKGFGIFEPDDALGYRETGTFLKMLAVALHARRMGFDTIYLLPISQHSDRFRKGSVGSPYAVSDPLRVAHYLADPLVDLSSEEQFGAFVEFCHSISMKVVLDFVPRTIARDSVLILDHPDWFYWIDINAVAKYAPPRAPELGFRQLSDEDMAYLYQKDNVREFIDLFRFAPLVTEPEKWANFVQQNRGKDFLPELVKTFRVITPPGFSDWLNDPQPTWDDVTFYRFYEDHPDVAKPFVSPEHPPYVLFDVIKSSRFPGSVPNYGLWEYVANMMAHYAEKYGVDGARVDMGHALPPGLEKMMIERVKSVNPDFVLIAEELNPSGDVKARESGYDAIIGNSWWMLPREEKIAELFRDSTTRALPTWSAVETPDTPRIFGRLPKEEALKRLILSAFLPNSYFVLNAGVELGEKQPMNLGLDARPEDRWQLDPSDEFYGKLAFFDHYQLHWDSGHYLDSLIRRINDIRRAHYEPHAQVLSTEPLVVKHRGASLVWNNTDRLISFSGDVLISFGTVSQGHLWTGSVAVVRDE